MIDSAQLAALAEVIGTGSFEAAAARLGITQSAISQRIRALEDRLGAALVVRSQPCTPTEAGARLARHAETVRLLERDALGGLVEELSPATIRIAVNADSLATWLLPALARVEGVLFDVILDDQDHSVDWLRRGEVQAAVTAHGTPIAGCDSHALGRLVYRTTASPAFAARWFADGVTAEALEAAPALTFNRKDRLQAIWAERAAGRAVRLRTHYIASSQAFVTASELGIGWGMNPEPSVRAALQAGRLVALCPEIELNTPLNWQVARLTGRALAPLTAAIRKAAATTLV